MPVTSLGVLTSQVTGTPKEHVILRERFDDGPAGRLLASFEFSVDLAILQMGIRIRARASKGQSTPYSSAKLGVLASSFHRDQGLRMNTLRSVFWEYPELTDERHLQGILETCRVQEDRRMYLWILRRFLEYGRAVDALRFFSLDEIAANVSRLRLSVYASAKWHRLVEVYRAA